VLRNLALVLALATAAAAAAASGCYASAGYAHDGYYGNGYGPGYVGPGVSVVSGHDYPVFYADRAYWAYNSGYWYTAPRLGAGWAFATPPAVVLSIHAPWSYSHYPYGYGRGYYGPAHYGHAYYGGANHGGHR
jgi:hypothetical protein